MPIRRHAHPTAFTVANELRELLFRYADLVSAQCEALQSGKVRTATQLSRSAEHVLAEAFRTDRRLSAAGALNPLSPDAWAAIRTQRQVANSQVRAAVARLGHLLATERDRLLTEFRHLDPNGANHRAMTGWSAPPSRVNVRT